MDKQQEIETNFLKPTMQVIQTACGPSKKFYQTSTNKEPFLSIIWSSIQPPSTGAVTEDQRLLCSKILSETIFWHSLKQGICRYLSEDKSQLNRFNSFIERIEILFEYQLEPKQTTKLFLKEEKQIGVLQYIICIPIFATLATNISSIIFNISAMYENLYDLLEDDEEGENGYEEYDDEGQQLQQQPSSAPLTPQQKPTSLLQETVVQSSSSLSKQESPISVIANATLQEQQQITPSSPHHRSSSVTTPIAKSNLNNTTTTPTINSTTTDFKEEEEESDDSSGNQDDLKYDYIGDEFGVIEEDEEELYHMYNSTAEVNPISQLQKLCTNKKVAQRKDLSKLFRLLQLSDLYWNATQRQQDLIDLCLDYLIKHNIFKKRERFLKGYFVTKVNHKGVNQPRVLLLTDYRFYTFKVSSNIVTTEQQQQQMQQQQQLLAQQTNSATQQHSSQQEFQDEETLYNQDQDLEQVIDAKHVKYYDLKDYVMCDVGRFKSTSENSKKLQPYALVLYLRPKVDEDAYESHYQVNTPTSATTNSGGSSPRNSLSNDLVQETEEDEEASTNSTEEPAVVTPQPKKKSKLEKLARKGTVLLKKLTKKKTEKNSSSHSLLSGGDPNIETIQVEKNGMIVTLSRPKHLDNFGAHYFMSYGEIHQSEDQKGQLEEIAWTMYAIALSQRGAFKDVYEPFTEYHQIKRPSGVGVRIYNKLKFGKMF